MIGARAQKQIPERLSHYTDLKSLKSILSDKEGKGICIWAFSNRHKNDDQEIRMGEYMLKRVRKALSTDSSMLHQFGGYENSSSISFNEGEVNKHMLKYGHYRLEFDLRDIRVSLLNGIIDCEYVAENDLKDYADEYCELIAGMYNSIPALQKKYGKISDPPINNLIGFIQMEIDIMRKVFCLKEQKWSEEREWRKVMQLNDKDKIRYYEGKPYVEYYLDKKYLTGITVFYSPGSIDQAKKDVDDIEKYISERGYNAKVRMEVFNGLEKS